MCQMCDEADAYLAEMEARAKKREDQQRKAEAVIGDRDERLQEDRARTARALE